MKRTSYKQVLWAVCLLGVVCGMGCGAPSPQPSATMQSAGREEVDPATRYHALAQQYAKNGDYEQAEVQYRKGLAMDPVSISMMRGLADVYMKWASRTKETLKVQGASADTSQAVQAFYDKAVEVYDEAIALEPENTDIMEGRAYVLTAAGRHDDAIAVYEQVARLKPDDPSVYVNLGYTYQKKGDIDAAAGAYSRAIEISPDDRDTILRLARMLYDGEREPESRTWFDRAYRLDSSDAALGRFLGALYIRAKDYESAVPIYASLIAQEPEDWRLQLNYGVALAEMDANEEALEAYREVMRLNPEKIEVYWETVDLLNEMGSRTEALALAEKGLAQAPESAAGYAALGRVYEKLKRFDDAKATFERGLALNDPRFNDYFKRQIPRQEQLKQREEALRDQEQYGYD